jgi:hypothetical protein
MYSPLQVRITIADLHRIQFLSVLNLTMPDSETRGSAQGSGGAYVRTTTVDDLDELGAMTQRAFISSSPQMFFSGATPVRSRFLTCCAAGISVIDCPR